MRSRHGPRQRAGRRAVAPRARCLRERAVGAVEGAAERGAFLRAGHAPPDHEVAVLRRSPQRLASRSAEAHHRIDRPRMQPMRAEIDGMPLEGNGHGAPADAVAGLEDRDRKPGREKPTRRGDAGRPGAGDDDVDLARGGHEVRSRDRLHEL
jgi:hypothetical protein